MAKAHVFPPLGSICLALFLSFSWVGCLGGRPSATPSGGAPGESGKAGQGPVARGSEGNDEEDDPDDPNAKPKGPSIIDRGVASECIGTGIAKVDDSEDGNDAALTEGSRDGRWYTRADSVGSSIDPKGPPKMSDGGANGSKKALRIRGKLADDKQAWAMVGVTMLSDGLYDASQFKGVTFFAKSGPKSTTKVRVSVPDGNTTPEGGVCKECHNHFAKDLTLTGDWKKYTVIFSELLQHPTWGDKFPSLKRDQIVGVQWSIVDQGKEFDVWIDDVQLLCEKVEKE